MKLLYCVLLALCISSIINAGDDFIAVKLSPEMQKAMGQIQQFIAHRVKKTGLNFSPAPAENLHITLKLIGDINNNDTQRALFSSYLQAVADKSKSFTLDNAFKQARLSLSGGLVKLVLAPHSALTDLATQIQAALVQAKTDGKLAVLSSRFDFPNHAHVTLGMLKANKSQQPTLKAIQQAFDPSKITVPPFIINEFVLLWSNKPQEPRRYDLKGTFNFTKAERAQDNASKYLQNLANLTRSLKGLSSHF